MTKFTKVKLSFLVLCSLLGFSVFVSGQSGCPAPNGVTFSAGNSKLITNWSPVKGAQNYKFAISYNKGPVYSKAGSATTSINQLPPSAYRIDIVITPVCKFSNLGDPYIGHIYAVQDDINVLCNIMQGTPQNEEHTFVFKNRNIKIMTAGQFVSTYCSIGTSNVRMSTDIGTTAFAPNPFKDHTSLHLDLEETSDVSIQIFGTNGQQYRNTFTSQMLDAGIYNLPINGNELPVGVYFVKLSVNGVQSTHKLMKVE